MATESLSAAGVSPVAGHPDRHLTAALLRMMHLGSASLPIGAYAWSQGMESAIDEGWLPDPDAVRDWLSLQMRSTLQRVDLPVFFRLYAALRVADVPALQHWNDIALACRETAELRLADTAMATALQRLCHGLSMELQPLDPPVAQLTVFAQASFCQAMPQHFAAVAYTWSWLEQQMGAANRLLPLGQSRSQSILDELMREIPAILEAASDVPDDDIGGGLPALAIASARHETLYSRLYRS